MKTVGFSGLGVMGLPISLHMVTKTKTLMYGYDVVPERNALFRNGGGIPVTDSCELYKNCDIIFLNLPTNAIAAAIMQECIDSCKKGAIIVDLGSTYPKIIQDMNAKAAKKGIGMIDSPVSGGEDGAIAGTLISLYGGEKDVFEQVWPFLSCAVKSATRMGPAGCGSIAKLANNMITGGNNVIAAEAFAFAVKAGIDPELLFGVIKIGLAGSNVLNMKMPRVLSRNFKPGARTAIHQKDLQNAVKYAEEMGVDVPIAKIVLEDMNELEVDGLINEDNSALVKLYEKRMGVEVRGKK
jgi:2-hydroxy-3-oxopropionate reductase